MHWTLVQWIEIPPTTSTTASSQGDETRGPRCAGHTIMSAAKNGVYTGARIAVSWRHFRIKSWVFGPHFQSHVFSKWALALSPYQPGPVDSLAQQGISSPKSMIFRLVKNVNLTMMPYLSFWQSKNFHVQLQRSAPGSTVAHLPCTFR